MLRPILPTLLLAALALGLAACADSYEPHGTLLDPPMEVPPFELVSDRGTVSTADLSGRLVILSFAFTACPDVCPDNLSRYARALRLLDEGEAERVEVVMISVDPERDTPERVGTYVRAFDERFIGLTGDPITIAQMSAGYGIMAMQVPGEQYPDGYTVDHTASTLVLDQNGQTVLIWGYGTDPEAMASDLRFLLRRS